MPIKGEYVKFKNYERKIKSPFMIYASFESIMVLMRMESKIQQNVIQANTKNILLAFTAIN